MKKFLILFCFLGLVAGCDVDYFGLGGSAHRGEFPDGRPPGENVGGSGSGQGGSGSGEDPNNPGGSGSGDNGGQDPAPEEHLYILTLEYPRGYNWLTDIDKGRVDSCYLVVYKDFNEVRRVRVSNTDMVPSDPDRAYVLEGDLYTFYPLETETVIKKNGDEFLRIPSAENIHSAMIYGGDFYTLGYGASSRSVSLRKDGESVIYVSDASIISGLYLDGGNVCFSYVVHSRPKKYFYCTGEMAFQLQGVGSDWTVYGLQTMYSQPMYVYRDEGYMVGMVHPQHGRSDFSVAPDESYFYEYELVKVGGDVVPVEHYRYGSSEDVTIFASRVASISGVTYSKSSIYGCDDRIVAVYDKKGLGYSVMEISGGVSQVTQMPSRFGYAPLKRGAAMVSGELYVGFSTKTINGETRIQTGRNQFKDLKFNGFVVALGK